MKKLSMALLAVTVAFSISAHADKNGILGPFPHERTDTPLKSNANVGRYLYVGTVPKLDASEIELTVSKMSLTLRATGWISQSKMDNFASQLYSRWELIDSTMKDPRFVLHPLVSLQSLPTKQTSIAWAKIAGQYSSHFLENRGIEIYNTKRNASALEAAGTDDEYRQAISTAILRAYFNDNGLTPEAIKADNMLRDRLLSPENSRNLFKSHYGDIFTSDSTRQGYQGFITLVYPIAATVEGPFDQPAEQAKTLMSYGSIEARWWSDKWDDEFGGFPFILINPSGVAFHGPITNFAPLDVWYLRRGYVSHGCHRMDSSDLLELRNILPRSIKELGKVRLTILDYFDVTDWNRDGKQEVVDVKYYNIPSAVSIPAGKSIDDAIKPYLIQNQMKSYFQNNAFASKFYNASTDMVTGTPKYKIQNGSLIKEGTHGPLPLVHFEYRPSRILQYKELGTQMVPYDDNGGKFPPTYFLNK